MKKCDLICCAVLSILFFSCNKEPKTIPVTGITINTSSLTLVEGETSDLIATISPKNADNQTVIWSTSDGSVASVSNGKVTAIKAGLATITATSDDGGITSTCVVTVIPKNISVKEVSLNIHETSLSIGETIQLIATVKPSTATDKEVEWISDDESVAIVNSEGIVQALKMGQVIISVITKDGARSDKCVVNIGQSGANEEYNGFDYEW